MTYGPTRIKTHFPVLLPMISFIQNNQEVCVAQVLLQPYSSLRTDSKVSTVAAFGLDSFITKNFVGT
jgi:hypothetical protein